MTKIKKRNELSIFEELRLKPATTTKTKDLPKEDDLHQLNILCKVDSKNNPISWWQKNSNGGLVQVDHLGELIFSGDKCREKNIPKAASLKKNKSKILVTVNKYNIPLTWWIKDENGELLKVNTKNDSGIEFKIKSWLRDKAIEVVGLEIRSMKKKAYEYSKDELMGMIEIEENKMIKKGGWKALRMAALSTLGLSWLPFI